MQRVYKAIRHTSDCHTDEAPNIAPLTEELFAHGRYNGRIFDSIRHNLGGSHLKGHFQLIKVYREAEVRGWTDHIITNPSNIILLLVNLAEIQFKTYFHPKLLWLCFFQYKLAVSHVV
jgi:hypothetical protein